MIHLQHTVIGYQQALLSIDELSIAPGKVFALLGLNGSGKSTFLKTLAAQIPPLAGTILVNQYTVELLAQDGVLRAQQIAFVSSRFDGVQHLKVLDYVALGRVPYASLFGKISRADLDLVKDTIEKIGLTHLSEKPTLALSDGERQMVSLARAFVQDTPVLLLDEPASFLDFLNREQLLRALMIWARQFNKCVVLSSHDIDLCIEHDLSMLLLAQQKIQTVQGMKKRR